MPRTPNAAPSVSSAQWDVELSVAGISRPTPTPSAIAVSPVRHHARNVRSFASRVRRVASSTPGSRWGSDGVGCVAELAELARDQVRHLLANVDGMIADALDAS